MAPYDHLCQTWSEWPVETASERREYGRASIARAIRTWGDLPALNEVCYDIAYVHACTARGAPPVEVRHKDRTDPWKGTESLPDSPLGAKAQNK